MFSSKSRKNCSDLLFLISLQFQFSTMYNNLSLQGYLYRLHDKNVLISIKLTAIFSVFRMLFNKSQNVKNVLKIIMEDPQKILTYLKGLYTFQEAQNFKQLRSFKKALDFIDNNTIMNKHSMKCISKEEQQRICIYCKLPFKITLEGCIVSEKLQNI